MKPTILAFALLGAAVGNLVLAQSTPVSTAAPRDPVQSRSAQSSPGTERTPAPLDFTPGWADVAPTVEASCASCHRAGGIAPFALESYEQARPMAAAMAEAVRSGQMPPWMPGGRTPPLRYERKLTDQEIGVIVAWAEAGAPQERDMTPSTPQTPGQP
ncbi:c-type cytochrome [Deinococcus sp. UR1]|uniref:c-type cytochrome n=1 Tax=Deinococcus sp. UR1 TaxID=1704277 RepID=UPI0006DC17ED|nr:cytochrome c [Deinococcus sp. UR1]PIG97081.1 hypothetical protein AMD26_014585 [Deinococcus sp. UR1]